MPKRTKKKVTKLLQQHTRLALIFIVGLSVLSYAGYASNRTKSVDPIAFAPLLNLIAEVESKGNYNAYYGNADNTRLRFTSMTIDEVLTWQSSHVEQGALSSAVGKYQIVNSTLKGLIKELQVDASEIFDQRLQDEFAVALLKRRGAEDYINGVITREQFAANLAKEWAALPKVVGDSPEESYYAKDGLNRSLVGVNQVLEAIKQADS